MSSATLMPRSWDTCNTDCSGNEQCSLITLSPPSRVRVTMSNGGRAHGRSRKASEPATMLYKLQLA